MAGVSSAGLKTTVLPATSAGADFQTGIAHGKFHGVIEADDAERLANRVGERVARFGGQRLAAHAEAFAGVVLEQGDALADLAARLAQDLALFAGQRPGDLVGAAAGDIGGAPQHAPALGPGRLLASQKAALAASIARCAVRGGRRAGTRR